LRVAMMSAVRGHKGRYAENPRSVAYAVLTAVDEKEAFADRALDGKLAKSPSLQDRDRRLATELVYGTLRRRGSLDRCLRPCLRRPLERLDPEIRRILRLGAYQILLLDRVPDHAAVNESVELANRFGRPGSGSLVNGALRALCRTKAEEQGRPSTGIRGGEADFPSWLTRIWQRDLGPERTDEILGALLATPETVLRTNTLKTDRSGLIHRLRGEGYEAEPVEGLPQAVVLPEGGDIRKADCYRQGWCVQQDGASQLIAEILDPRPGESVLDLCAAPGIKTTHIAEKMADKGLVVALDSNPGRLRELVEGCGRMGVTVASPLCGDASGPGNPLAGTAVFDRVLVDAPCSGLGILRRNPEKKWRAAPDFATLSSLQARLVRTAAVLVRPGGILVYSTCTVHREENEAIVEGFLAESGDFVLEEATPFLPKGFEDLASEAGYFSSWARPSRFDLFFAARLRRVSRRITK
jgi:16S rRNA (cytosine967-C5)-methyltransferase